MEEENNPFLGVGESLYYTGYLCYTVAMLQTFEGGISVYEKSIILNTLVYSVWCFYFSRQILKERFTPVKTAVIILAEAYGHNAVEKTKTLKSETFDDYSYTSESNTVDLNSIYDEIAALLEDFKKAKSNNLVNMSLRKL